MTTADTIRKIRSLTTEKNISITYKNQDFEFQIRPVNSKSLAMISGIEGVSELEDKFKDEKGEKKDKLSNSDAAKAFSDTLWPLIRIIIPECCISPKIIDDEGSNQLQDCLRLSELPIQVLTDLITEIFELSGLSSAEEQEAITKK